MSARPSKRAKLDKSLIDDVAPGEGFSINKDFARRFEHNHQRAEQHRLEEKDGKQSTINGRNGAPQESDGDEADDSSTEDEDDYGELATEGLDKEISATLAAIRKRDPKVYDKTVKFYTDVEETIDPASTRQKEKPMFLRDYHRETLLNGSAMDIDGEEEPISYSEQQAELQNSIVRQMHEAAAEGAEELEDDREDAAELLKPKTKHLSSATDEQEVPLPVKAAVSSNLDVAAANTDPEGFLSKFLESRAWIPSGGEAYFPLESDESADDQKAEDFEAAYNLRFEDPATANEKLRTHARDVAAAQSVRKDDTTTRKRARELRAEAKLLDKQERQNERRRLRKLKLGEMEQRLEQIGRAAGVRRGALNPDDWAELLKPGWEGEDWEAQMRKHFDDEYYAGNSADEGEADETGIVKRSKKAKKPAWEDEIEIKDMVAPGDEEPENQGKLPSSSDEGDPEASSEERHTAKTERSGKSKSKSKKAEHSTTKANARSQRRALETLVDAQLPITLTLDSLSREQNQSASDPSPSYAAAGAVTPRAAAPFRYRDGSPETFGLTAREILLAPDVDLNSYAGLKALGQWREPERKVRDRRKIGKKGRLRQWRKETFGDAAGKGEGAVQETGREDGVGGGLAAGGAGEGEGEVGKKRKRKKKGRSGGVEAGVGAIEG